jgi:hypothetical protein
MCNLLKRRIFSAQNKKLELWDFENLISILEVEQGNKNLLNRGGCRCCR